MAEIREIPLHFPLPSPRSADGVIITGDPKIIRMDPAINVDRPGW
jgi:hypothetical protein